MQFLHLFSFVVVASYAAALPQPAGLSEKYPNDVDATLAPGLEARSYQPGSNSYKDSAAVMLLKRQDGTKDIKKILDDATKRGDFSSANISSTIDKVGDGIFNFPEDGEKVAQKVDGILGEMLSGYIKRSTYVGTALDKWMRVEEVNILLTIKSILGDDVFSRLFPVFLGKSKELTDSVTAKEKEVAEATSNILKDTGTVIQNVEKIHASFKLAFDSRMTRFDLLKTLLGNSEAAETPLIYFFNMRTSLDKFLANQQRIHDEIIKRLSGFPFK